jgi:hypothetical protein
VANPLILVIRAALRIRNRAGELESFSMRLDQDQSVRVDYTPAPHHQRPEIKPRKRVIDVPLPNGRVRRMVSPASEVEMAAIQEKLKKRHGAEVSDIHHVTTEYPAATFSDVGSVAYSDLIPGVIKIAYELGFYWLGGAYLEDPGAADIREWLHAIVDGEIGFKTPPELKSLQLFYRADPFPRILANRPEHVAFLDVRPGEGVFCWYRIFNVLGAKVLIARETERYVASRWKDVLVFDPIARTFRRLERSEVLAAFDHAPQFLLERSIDADGVHDRVEIMENGRKVAYIVSADI